MRVTPLWFTFNVTQVNSVAVASTWTTSTPVDYVQPQFRVANVGDDWTNGTQIPGDRNTFILTNLNQATAYDLRLIFYLVQSFDPIITNNFIASTCETGVAGIDECTTGKPLWYTMHFFSTKQEKQQQQLNKVKRQIFDDCICSTGFLR